MTRPDHRKSKDAFPTSCPTEGTRAVLEPLFLKFPAQDVYEDIVILPCNVRKCRNFGFQEQKATFESSISLKYTNNQKDFTASPPHQTIISKKYSGKLP
jgi:hypothetical protein